LPVGPRHRFLTERNWKRMYQLQVSKLTAFPPVGATGRGNFEQNY